jgi:hypothetical protein
MMHSGNGGNGGEREKEGRNGGEGGDNARWEKEALHLRIPSWA